MATQTETKEAEQIARVNYSGGTAVQEPTIKAACR